MRGRSHRNRPFHALSHGLYFDAGILNPVCLAQLKTRTTHISCCGSVSQRWRLQMSDSSGVAASCCSECTAISKTRVRTARRHASGRTSSICGADRLSIVGDYPEARRNRTRQRLHPKQQCPELTSTNRLTLDANARFKVRPAYMRLHDYDLAVVVETQLV